MGRLPQFLIVGAQKCGTDSLHRWLNDHPQCFMSPLKEPHFFARFEPWDGLPVVRDIDTYKALFKESQYGQICGESSPSYLFEDNCAERIYNLIPTCKIIITLRDPVERAYSEYKMNVIGGYERRAFCDAVKDAIIEEGIRKSWSDFPLYVELGKYGTQMARYFETFPREQILVLTLSDIARDSMNVMKRVSRFLEVEEDFWENYPFLPHNVSAVPKNNFYRRMLASKSWRFLGRMIVPKGLRPWVAANILGRRSSHQDFERDVTLEVRQMVWDILENEILMAENLIGRHLPNLWKTFPRNA